MLAGWLPPCHHVRMPRHHATHPPHHPTSVPPPTHPPTPLLLLRHPVVTKLIKTRIRKTDDHAHPPLTPSTTMFFLLNQPPPHTPPPPPPSIIIIHHHLRRSSTRPHHHHHHSARSCHPSSSSSILWARSSSPPVCVCHFLDGLNRFIAVVVAARSPASAGMAERPATRRWYYPIPAASGEPRGPLLAASFSNAIGASDPAPRSTSCQARRRPSASTRRGPRRARSRLARAASRRPARGDGGPAALRDPLHRACRCRHRGIRARNGRRRGVVRRPRPALFATIWDAAALETHKRASEALYRDQGPRVRRRQVRAWPRARRRTSTTFSSS